VLPPSWQVNATVTAPPANAFGGSIVSGNGSPAVRDLLPVTDYGVISYVSAPARRPYCARDRLFQLPLKRTSENDVENSGLFAP
jgi:hypothetical protein